MEYKSNIITKDRVIEAIEEFEKLKSSYKESANTVTYLLHEGKRLPAKQIRKMAYQIVYGKEIPNGSGGIKAKKFFIRLGFDVEYRGTIYLADGSVTPKAVGQEIFVKKFELKAKDRMIQLQGIVKEPKDYMEETKKNIELGDSGEAFVYQYECEQIKIYQLDSKKEVIRASKLYGDGLGYDILSYDENGKEKYIEVKTTTGKEDSSIYITANELKMSEEYSEQYYMYRVYEFNQETKTGKISIRQGSLKPLCISAQTYKVDFK